MKRPKGKRISQNDGHLDTSLSPSSTPHPTFCDQYLLDIQDHSSYTSTYSIGRNRSARLKKSNILAFEKGVDFEHRLEHLVMVNSKGPSSDTQMNDPAASCRVAKPKGYSPAASCGGISSKTFFAPAKVELYIFSRVGFSAPKKFA
jgi:hypothetical protein